MHRSCVFSLLALLVLAAPVAATDSAPWLPRGARLSSAYERMLRDRLQAGLPVDPALVRRHLLDAVDERDPAGEGAAPDATARTGARGGPVVWMAADVQANDRTGDASCAACGGRPLPQAETTIAALGANLVAGWNDSKGFCPPNGAVQGWATSTDGGVTWTDRGDVPAPAAGFRYRGDPVHMVNPTTGQFYVLGLVENPTNPALSGLALLNGHFAAGTFVVDGNRTIAAGGANFLDKPWIAVDPASGNLYVTYSNFVGGSTSQIELIRSTDGGNTWSAPLLMHGVSQNGNVQGSRPAVGPDGEVYVYWYTFGTPLSEHHVRRSDDGGLSFGPDVIAATFFENGFSGGAGYRRGFAPTFASIAVDRSAGPTRGRVHLAWDESVNFYDAPAPALGPRSEVESNASFANATSFTVGQVLRGTTNATAPDTLDLWRFAGNQGQTVFLRCDSATTNAVFAMRLQCDAETTLFQNFRFLAFSNSTFPAIAYTLPRTGTYYLRLFRTGGAAANYRLLTSWDTPSPGERAADTRDQFATYSNDGTTWQTPLRISDGPAWTDAIFPEIAVDDRGRVFVAWHDWREDLVCGARSTEYTVASGNGGVTWGANRRLSDSDSFWSINACGSANQGDYQGIHAAGSTVYTCWSDSRNGDPDAFVEVARHSVFPDCPYPLASGPGTQTLTFHVINTGTVPSAFGWSLSDTRGWLVSAVPGLTGSVSLDAGASLDVTATFMLPAGCFGDPDIVTFAVADGFIPGAGDTCRAYVSCSALDADRHGPREISFSAPRPNPSNGRVTFEFALPHESAAELAILSADGRRVRGLANGFRNAGSHAITWDGRDEVGRAVPPGVYWAQLRVDGRAWKRLVTLVR